mmetsp:Transcript_8645/g.13408  ORF Transcript_8645/g.13408 Transcript_8645/m.13408 type:complete len:146 (+) Transcript_8645:283-720(+)
MVGDDSEFMKRRVRGFKNFLAYLINHPFLCDQNSLKVFLTGNAEEFEAIKNKVAEQYTQPIHSELAKVLLDGADMVDYSDLSSQSYGQSAINSAIHAVKGIGYYGGAIGGALWNGASYVIGKSGSGDEASLLADSGSLTDSDSDF